MSIGTLLSEKAYPSNPSNMTVFVSINYISNLQHYVLETLDCFHMNVKLFSRNYHDASANFVRQTDTLLWNGKAGLEKMENFYYTHRYLKVISMDKICMRDTTKQTFLDTVKFDTWRQA